MFGLFKPNRRKQAHETGQALFEVALNHARSDFPDLFAAPKPATEDPLRTQRFEAVALAMSVILWRLHREADLRDNKAIAQAAHDSMFLSFDRSLREGGVGDIGVSHKIKKYAQAFYGRLERYTKALDAQSSSDLKDGLVKNIGLPAPEAQQKADETLAWARGLEKQGLSDILKDAQTQNH